MSDLLNQLTGSEMMYLLVLVAVPAAVLLLFAGLRSLAASRTDADKERLMRRVGASAVAAPAERPTSADPSGGESLLMAALAPVAQIATPKNEAELSRLRAKLSAAGYRNRRALVTYLGLKVVLGFGLAIAFLWFDSRRAEPFTQAALFTIASMAAGFYLPTLWLASRVAERQKLINHALPNALDLLVTCVEAGLGLDAALARVADELRVSAPLFAEELAQTSFEMRAGVARGDAFRRLAERTGVEELRNLAAIIVQTQMFGTSVAKSLRTQAESMRSRRMNSAEERAAAVSVKMTVPLILCILPALFAVLMGPAVVKGIRILLPTLGGH